MDEDELNSRVKPVWERHRRVLERRGFRLDTARDVRRYYECFLRDGQTLSVCDREAYAKACQADDDALNGDAGLVRVSAMCYKVPSSVIRCLTPNLSRIPSSVVTALAMVVAW